jgi:hypothetical protein
MSSVDPKIIQNIRIRKQAQDLLKKAEEMQSMRARLVELSGIRERGIDPATLEINDAYLPVLLEAAQSALNTGDLFNESDSPKTKDELPTRVKRQRI